MKDGIFTYEPLWGEWYIDDKVGEGSYGKVYHVHKLENGQRVEAAVKYISIPKDAEDKKSMIANEDAGDDASFKAICDDKANFYSNEINLMAALAGQKNIVGYEDHIKTEKKGEIGWDIIIRMEILTPLVEYIEKNGFTERDAVNLGRDICSALDACHRRNIIHRDVKLDNIFVDKDGNFKLGDFGVSRAFAENKTTQATIAGTVEYMAPEMLLNKKYNSAVDVYSLGVVLYKLLNEKRGLFLTADGTVKKMADKELAEQKRLQGTEELPKPKFGSDRLFAVVKRACAFAPADRYADLTEMRSDLEAAMADAGEGLVLSKSNASRKFDWKPFPSPVFDDEPTFDEHIHPKKKAGGILPVVIGAAAAALLAGVLILGPFGNAGKGRQPRGEAPVSYVDEELPAGEESEQAEPVKLERISLPSALSVVEGDETVISVVTFPKEADEKLIYASSDENVVTVDEDGHITAVAAGEAQITVSGETGNVSGLMTVTVVREKVPVEEIRKRPAEDGTEITEYPLYVGSIFDLSGAYEIVPENATWEEILYTSDSEAVSVAENGVVTGVVPGEAVVTVSVDGKTCRLPFTVIAVTVPVEDIVLKEQNVNMTVGATRMIEYTVVPENATITETPEYISSNPKIVLVNSDGTCTAKSAGSAKITVRLGELSKEISVTVKKQETQHKHSYGAVQTEATHPHRQFKVCKTCGSVSIVQDSSYLASCQTCNPPPAHVHTYGVTQTEAAHPHRQFSVCTGCGDVKVVSGSSYSAACQTCNVHVHSFGTIQTEATHPHRQFRTCSCGETQLVGSSSYLASCPKCNPDVCKHQFGQVVLNPTHPHPSVDTCTICGYQRVFRAENYDHNCTICNPPPKETPGPWPWE